MSWHNELFREMGWFEELRQKKIASGDICGGCGEWPEFCCCKEPCCQDSCVKMDGGQQADGDV